jgi:hypothetical protein
MITSTDSPMATPTERCCVVLNVLVAAGAALGAPGADARLLAA